MDRMQTFMHILLRLHLLIVRGGGGERVRRRSNSNEPNAPIAPKRSFQSSRSSSVVKRRINTKSVSIAPRQEVMNIMIMINQEEDDQHGKCISSTKR